jgi:hypothetical protein
LNKWCFVALEPDFWSNGLKTANLSIHSMIFEIIPMVPFFFRSERLEQELMMHVGLQDIHTKESIPGLIAATVINFSPKGACLIIPNPAIDGKHLFFDTLHSNRYNLVLFFAEQGNGSDSYTIAAESVWMDSCEYQSKSAFKIGIRFLHNQNKLFHNLKKKFDH